MGKRTVSDPFSQLRDMQEEFLAGVDAFDRSYYERFGRFPEESGLTVESLRNDARRARIQALAEQGATEGERAAARAALSRFDVSHAEHDRMQRGGNWIE